jgi:ribose/xylose/arabinose/galactoside ABC-type transport system permease subunit
VTATDVRAVSGSSQLSDVMRRWLYRPEAPGLVFLVALMLLFAFAVDNFARWGNLHSILLQVSVTAIIAMGVNLVILGGEIDISMGSVLGLTAVGAGTVAVATGNLLAALGTGVGIGLVVGAVTGAIVTKGRVPAIIVTLGMLYALRGVILFVTGGRSVSGIPMEARTFGRGEWFGIGAPVWLLGAVLLVTWYLARHTTWGRDVYAVGGNRRAARMAGLRTDRVRWLTFVVSGGLVGLAAVVLGGTSIAGGRGSAVSPVIGALIIGVIDNAMVLQRVPATWQSAVLGLLILAAVTVDGLRSRVLRGGKR